MSFKVRRSGGAPVGEPSVDVCGPTNMIGLGGIYLLVSMSLS